MNTWLRYSLLIVLNISQAVTADDSIETIAGPLFLTVNKATNKCEYKIKEQTILSFDCEYSYTPDVLGVFNGNFNEFTQLVVIQESPMGNACNGGPLHLIAFNKKTKPFIFKPIDFCGGKDPILKGDAKSVTITFPGGPPNRGEGYIPTETWYFNGKISKQRAH